MRGDNYPDRPAKMVVAGHTEELRKRGVRFARNSKTYFVERDDDAHRQGTFVALRETFQIGAKLREPSRPSDVAVTGTSTAEAARSADAVRMPMLGGQS